MEKTSRKLLYGGNWKCNGDKGFLQTFDSTLKSLTVENDKAEVVVFPTSLLLKEVREKYDHIRVGSQNVSQFGNGAYTGELSPELLKDIGITTTLIGHSERRLYFGDDEQTISAKIKNAEKNGMFIVLCIGENLQQRESNQTMDVVFKQLETVKTSIVNWSNLAIAYEPVWAIGTGKTASPEQAEEVHAEIRKWLEQSISKEVANQTRIIYGGSVTKDNCEALIKKTNIDGFLVGGASLKADFKIIVDSYKLKQ